MARGIDTSRDPRRNLGPGSSLHQAIVAESQTQKYLFGTLVGTQDSGERTLKRPAPPEGGVFHGAEPNAIKLAQMRVNREAAMGGLMQPPPDNARKSGLVDTGLGRESVGREFPVHSYVDERIKKR